MRIKRKPKIELSHKQKQLSRSLVAAFYKLVGEEEQGWRYRLASYLYQGFDTILKGYDYGKSLDGINLTNDQYDLAVRMCQRFYQLVYLDDDTNKLAHLMYDQMVHIYIREASPKRIKEINRKADHKRNHGPLWELSMLNSDLKKEILKWQEKRTGKRF